jgi:integrase
MTAKRVRANGEGSIFPYRTGYAAYVWVTKPDGTRTRKYVYGKTREEVHDKWIKLHQQAREGPVATNTPTLGAYLAYWLKEVIEPNRAPATFDNYERFVRLYIRPGLGDRRLNRLQARDVQVWINKVARTCQCCAQGKDAARPEKKRRCCAKKGGACCEDYPSPRMVSDIRNTLRSALSHAISEELVAKNLASSVKLAPVRKPKRKAWTTDEARRFLESARENDDPLYAAYVLVLVLGLRRGEVLGLVWSDVDLDGAELSVGLQLQRIRRRLHHRATKTDTSDAALPLPDICVAALRHRQSRQDAAKRQAGPAWQRSKFIFTTQYGTPIEPRNFFRSFVNRIEKAGVRRISVHDARRTCASLLADLDVHPRVAMQILRHADFKVTMEIYTQVSSGQTREALKRLGESLDRS